MFEYFDGNYTWNMAVNLALAMGGSIGDIDDVSRSLRTVAQQNDDEAAEQFFATWDGLGRKVAALAAKDQGDNRTLSAAAKYRRASIYHIQAERMQRPSFQPRADAFASSLECFSRFISLSGENCRRCEVPYLETALPALFVPAKGLKPGQRAPCMIHFDGLDVTKEIIYLLGMPEALAARGISTLVVDNPGVGESLRLRNLYNSAEAEVPAGAAIDYLTGRSEIDPDRIGIMAISMGGYHAPRAAAFEPRIACCVAWGAQYDWGSIQRKRMEDKQSSLPVPHYWEHVRWVFGVQNDEDFLDVSSKISLHGLLARIECPFLIAHGENDRQIPLETAWRVAAESVNSSKVELLVHTVADGGAEHCSIDNIPLTREAISDWVSEILLNENW